MGIKLTHEYESLSKMVNWAVNVVHLVEYLWPMRETLGSIPEWHELSVVVHTCNPRQVEAGNHEVLVISHVMGLRPV